MAAVLQLAGKIEGRRVAGSWTSADNKRTGTFRLRLPKPPANSQAADSASAEAQLPVPGRCKLLLWNNDEDPVHSELKVAHVCFERVKNDQSNIRGFVQKAAAGGDGMVDDPTKKILGTYFLKKSAEPNVHMTVLLSIPAADFPAWRTACVELAHSLTHSLSLTHLLTHSLSLTCSLTHCSLALFSYRR